MTKPSPPTLDAVLRQVREALAQPRYTGGALFKSRLATLQLFQGQRMRQTHTAWQLRAPDAVLLTFIVDEVYRGIDLSSLDGRLGTAARVLETLFNDLELVHAAIAFTALTSSLDDELVQLLGPALDTSTLAESDYVAALAHQKKIADRMGDRLRQGQYLVAFSTELIGLLDDPSAWRAIVLAKYPARLAGFGTFHTLVSNGISAMQKVDDAGVKIAALVADEARYFSELK